METGITASVVYRPARHEDKNGVLAIVDDPNGGRDYLQSTYDHMISNKNTNCFVAEIDNEIIGFCVGYIVDDGTTIVLRTGRVKPQFLGKGIYMTLSNMCIEVSKASRQRFYAHRKIYTVRPSILTKYHKTLILKLFHMISDRINVRLPYYYEQNLQNLPDNELMLLFTSERARRYLFTDDVITVRWILFQPLPSNIPLLRDFGEQVIIFSDFQDTGREMRGLLTVWSYFLKGNTLVCAANVYGNEISRLGSHLASFLTTVRTEIWDKLDLIVNFDSDYEQIFFRELAVEFNIKTYGWTEDITHTGEDDHGLFEKEIK